LIQNVNSRKSCFLTSQLATVSDLHAKQATTRYSRGEGSLLAKRAMKAVSREARIITREGERWITTRAEYSFSQNFT